MPSSVWAIAIFDIDGVVRDVSNSYRRALADTVEHFTSEAYRPSQQDIDNLKAEGIWNNDWEASQELIARYFEQQSWSRDEIKRAIAYSEIVEFFQRRYRGDTTDDTSLWNGYICQEPLLMELAYLETLSQAGVAWGFFSGATTGSARYVLEHRLGLKAPPLIAMEDAPGKPEPIGLFQTIQRIEAAVDDVPVFYAGDTVADMQTINNARHDQPHRSWVAVGVLPPHVQQVPAHVQQATARLKEAGAHFVLRNVQELTPSLMQAWLDRGSLT